MEQKEFRFDEATPLLQFIDRYRDRIVGHTLKACYVDGFLYVKFDGASSPVFLVLDDSCIGIEYLYPGHATIITAEESDFETTGEILNDTRYKMITFHITWSKSWLSFKSRKAFAGFGTLSAGILFTAVKKTDIANK